MLAPAPAEMLALIGGVVATVPNIALGVVILIFRKRILDFVVKRVPIATEDGEFWVSRAILVGGLFLIVVAGFLLFTAVQTFFMGIGP